MCVWGGEEGGRRLFPMFIYISTSALCWPVVVWINMAEHIQPPSVKKVKEVVLCINLQLKRARQFSDDMYKDGGILFSVSASSVSTVLTMLKRNPGAHIRGYSHVFVLSNGQYGCSFLITTSCSCFKYLFVCLCCCFCTVWSSGGLHHCYR